MKFYKNKTMAIATAILFVFSMVASTTLLPSTNAHTPAWQIPTYASISVAPNPIGVGQSVNVNFWINMPPPTANAQYGDRWHNFKVTVTKPDGSNETLGPYSSDDVGGAYLQYTPTVTGNYTFQFSFPGQTLAGENLSPTGAGAAAPFIGDYYQPSISNSFTIVVQQEPIGYAAVNPLPTDYWTRPIYGENNEWSSIGGNWLGLGASTFAITGMYNASANYNAYTTAPNSAHILWTKPEAFGGIIGGEFGATETGNYYSTSQYEPKFAPIIMQGVLYYTLFPGSSTNPAGWAAVDLHTGQVLWTKSTTEELRCGQILHYVSPNQYGGLAYLWTMPQNATGFGGVPGGTYYGMYDAMTGNWILNIVGAPTMTLIEDQSGSLIGYYVNSTTKTLNMWNSTQAILNYGLATGQNPNTWMWRPPQGASINFSLGIQWAAPLATNISNVALPATLGISAIQSDVVLLTAANSTGGSYYQPGWQIEAGYSAIDGHQLWLTNRTELPYSRIIVGSTTAGNGVYVEFAQSDMTSTGYSLTTGKPIWGPITLPNANPFGTSGIQTVVANGTIYTWDYGGDVYAINMNTGAILWQYHTPPGGYESPYGIEPLWTFTVGTIADGKLFVPEGHMYSPPLFHNAQQLALNLTTGQPVWSIDAFDVTSAPAISDGIMTTLNAYDNQIYAYGKGPSAMTVTAPSIGVTTATPITISGTVIDLSAGTKQQAPAANFPNGLPCVSDASMTQWMEYVYMQQPAPTNVTGVPVTISVLDSNGNYRTIGHTTSDDSGTFALTWTPDITGNYTIVATFAGSESYYSTSAETHFYANGPALTAAPYPIVTLPPTEMYFAISTTAIIIAIAIVAVLVLKKRP
jgi:outer membrane protein assembly factor BamB